MNKEKFIKKLVEETGYDKEKCTAINSVLESHFIIGKKGKEKIINDFVDILGIDNITAEGLYEKCISILGSAGKEKLRHPFRSND